MVFECTMYHYLLMGSPTRMIFDGIMMNGVKYPEIQADFVLPEADEDGYVHVAVNIDSKTDLPSPEDDPNQSDSGYDVLGPLSFDKIAGIYRYKSAEVSDGVIEFYEAHGNIDIRFNNDESIVYSLQKAGYGCTASYEAISRLSGRLTVHASGDGESASMIFDFTLLPDEGKIIFAADTMGENAEGYRNLS